MLYMGASQRFHSRRVSEYPYSVSLRVDYPTTFLNDACSSCFDIVEEELGNSDFLAIAVFIKVEASKFSCIQCL